jgi:quercetin dioxygenase-like cupin family protein
MKEATPTVFIDNERVRVTEWRFAPGAATGWHRHEYDYVVVPMLDGKLRIVTEGGAETIAELSKGVPYFRNVGVEHDVINANVYEFAFIEVEMK